MKEKLNKISLFILPLVSLLMVIYCSQKGKEFSISAYIIVIQLYIILYLLLNFKSTVFDVMHKYRYVIAGVIFTLLVIFKFHGSSIAMWDNYYKDYGNNPVKTLYSGEVRSVRSDEWLVQTPLYLSQVVGEDKFERINKNIRSEGQDMVLSSYCPVKDPTIIVKPFSWGFLFLDKDRAFSWYWNLKVISLIMISYEMAYILTRKNKKLALFGACLIAYAPACQWWFSTFVVDLIIFAQGIMVSVYYYLKSINFKKKIAYLLMFICSGGGFVLSLYPAMQVPLAYMIAIFSIYNIIKNRENIKIKDIILIALSICVILGIAGYFIYTAKDAIVAMMSTKYPGQRIEVGGDLDLNILSNYVFNWLEPFRDINFSNSCEVSGFIGLLPLTLIMFFFRDKEKDNGLKISIFIFILAMLVYLIIGFPLIIAKVTLFTFSPAIRMQLACGLASTYLLLGLIPDFIENKKVNNILVIVFAGISIVAMFAPQYHTKVQEYMFKSGIVTAIIVFGLMAVFALKGYVNELVNLGIVFVLIGGALVNPISRTLAPIYEKEVSKAIKSINDNEAGKWVALDDNIGGNLLYANGVKSFNGVHYYPDMAMWQLLDEDGEYEDVYNRYAHVVVNLTTEDTDFEIIQSDAINVNLSVNDLEKTEIKYLLTHRNLDDFNKNEVLFEKKYYNDIDKVYIYEYVG